MCAEMRKKIIQSNLSTTITLGDIKMATIDWGSLFGGHFCNNNSKLDLKMVIVKDRWSQFRSLLRFDLIYLTFDRISNCAYEV